MTPAISLVKSGPATITAPNAPITYTYAVLVVEKKAFERLEADDQAVMREVMGRIYADFDRQSQVDNAGALEAMLANGIEVVAPEDGAVEFWRDKITVLNREQVDQGHLSATLYDQMLALLDEYRKGAGSPVALKVSVLAGMSMLAMPSRSPCRTTSPAEMALPGV